MKQLISDCVLDIQPEPSGQTLRNSLAFAGLYTDTKLLSDESKLLLLIHSYLDLRLNLDQALRAARADVMMEPKAASHRLWVEQPQ
jgi:hypothetical protein